jgi:membrane protein implicated in regulation of membrane protease activity
MDEFVAWLWDVDHWHWWALALLLFAAEVYVTSSYLIWPAAAAALVGSWLVIDPDLDWRYQVLGFACLSVVAVGIWHWWRRRHPPVSDHPGLNTRGARFIDRVVTLSEPIDHSQGRIKIDGDWWQVTVASGDAVPAGTEVRVVAAEGTTLVVEPKTGA